MNPAHDGGRKPAAADHRRAGKDDDLIRVLEEHRALLVTGQAAGCMAALDFLHAAAAELSGDAGPGVIGDLLREPIRGVSRFQGGTEDARDAWLRQVLADASARLAFRYRRAPRREGQRYERAALLADALARLPASCREVLVLTHLEALSFAEVARRMGRSVPRVKKLWARALGRLCGLLG
jgi:RNA polymerase sigma factor (sigma-70 family)